jgi:hypothetical protein
MHDNSHALLAEGEEQPNKNAITIKFPDVSFDTLSVADYTNVPTDEVVRVVLGRVLQVQDDRIALNTQRVTHLTLARSLV